MTSPAAAPVWCDVCKARPAAFVTDDFEEPVSVCDPCRARFDCMECGVVPEPGSGCDCPGGRPTLPRFEPL